MNNKINDEDNSSDFGAPTDSSQSDDSLHKNLEVEAFDNTLTQTDPELFEIMSFKDSPWPVFPDEATLFESTLVEAQQIHQVDRSVTTLLALSAMSLGAQGLIKVQRPINASGDNAQVVASLFSFIILQSGDLKTTLKKHFFDKIENFEQSLEEDYDQQYKAYLLETEKQKIKAKVAKDELGRQHKKWLLVDEEDVEHSREVHELYKKIEKKYDEIKASQPSLPHLTQFIYKNVTPQALILAMKEHGKNAILLSDEASQVLDGQALKDLGLLNSLWDDGSADRTRVNAPPLKLKGAQLSMLLMVQNKILERYFDKNYEKMREVGFLARCLYAAPNRVASKPTGSFESTQSLKVDAFQQRIIEQIKKSLEREKNQTNKTILEFNTTAKKDWHQFYQNLLELTQENNLLEHHTDYVKKIMDNVSRIAGLIHYFEYGEKTSEIGSQTLKYAYQIGIKSLWQFMTHIAQQPEIVLHTEEFINYLFEQAVNKKRLQYDSNLEVDIHTATYNGVRYTLQAGRKITFKKTDITGSGPRTFRNNNKNFNRCIELLKKMGHIKEKSWSNYKEYTLFEAFDISASKLDSSTGFLTEKVNEDYPLKNGEMIYIRNLPKYEQQVLFSPNRTKEQIEMNNKIKQFNRTLKCYIVAGFEDNAS